MGELLISNSQIIASVNQDEKLANLLNSDYYSPMSLSERLRLSHSTNPKKIFRNLLTYLQKNKITFLKQMYGNELLIDAIESGYIDLTTGETVEKLTNQRFQVVAGFIFESFIARKINENLEIKSNVIKWVTDSNRKLSKKELEKYEAIAIGKQGISSKYPQYYKPTDPSIDIMFVYTSNNEKKPLLNKENRYASLQIKAVTSNYNQQIIRNIKTILGGRMNNGTTYPSKYDKVLTLLKEENGTHTFAKCMDILNKEYKQSIISSEEYAIYSQRISSPDSLGFDQSEIDNYYELIRYWYLNPSEFKPQELDDNFKNGLVISNMANDNDSNLNEKILKRQHIILPI